MCTGVFVWCGEHPLVGGTGGESELVLLTVIRAVTLYAFS